MQQKFLPLGMVWYEGHRCSCWPKMSSHWSLFSMAHCERGCKAYNSSMNLEPGVLSASIFLDECHHYHPAARPWCRTPLVVEPKDASARCEGANAILTEHPHFQINHQHRSKSRPRAHLNLGHKRKRVYGSSCSQNHGWGWLGLCYRYTAARPGQVTATVNLSLHRVSIVYLQDGEGIAIQDVPGFGSGETKTCGNSRSATV